MTDDAPTRTVSEEEIEQIRTHVDDIAEAARTLRELGVEHDLPVVECTAERIEGTVDPLDAHVPPELSDR